MRLEASIKNTFSAITMQLVAMLIGLILPRLYLSNFGSEVNGLVSSITQFIAYFTLVEAGLASATTTTLYLPLAEDNHNRVNEILAAAKKFYFRIGYIFSGLVLCLALIYPSVIKTNSLTNIEMGILVLVLGFNGAFDFFTLSRYRALLTADQRYYIVANASTLASIINFLLVVLTMYLNCSVVVVRTVALTSFILRSLLLNIYVRRNYKYVDYSVTPDHQALNKRWDAMILQLLGLAQNALPVVMLTFFSNLKVVSVYSIYNMVAASILSILASITNGFSASFGDMIAKKETEVLQKTYIQYELLFFMLMIWAYSCMNILYLSFIRIYTAGIHDVNYLEPLVAFLFVLNGLAYSFKTPAGTLIGSAGVFKETKPSTMIQTAIAIGLSLLLTPFWGIVGVLIALIISNLYRDIDLVIFMSKNVTKLPCRQSFIRILNGILMFGITNLPFHFLVIDTGGFGQWFLTAIGVALWSMVVVITYNLIADREVLFQILRRLNGSKIKLYRRRKL
ncbi:MAG: lipopolysaccharide biosynthesis protein [Desulfitobacterium sp.]